MISYKATIEATVTCERCGKAENWTMTGASTEYMAHLMGQPKAVTDALSDLHQAVSAHRTATAEWCGDCWSSFNEWLNSEKAER